MNIAELCTRPVQVIHPDEPLSEAARLMQRHNIGALVVVDRTGARPRPIGIVTDRDIVCGQLDRRADLHCLTVADVMTRDPATVRADRGVRETLETLRAMGVRRAPVVDRSGELVGIVTIDDLLPVLASKLNTLAALMGGQAKREGRAA